MEISKKLQAILDADPKDLTPTQRHTVQRHNEKISQIEYENPSSITGVKKPKRFIDEAIPSHNLKWLQSNSPDLEGAYIDYVGKQARFLDSTASFLSEQFGIDLHKEHPISASGAGDIERSPTNPLSDKGPNDQGFAGNARFNRRLQADNAFKRADLDELGIASNWQYSVANFVADRPDIRDPALRAEIGLKPLGPKVSNLGMLKLQQGDLDIDTLRMKMFIEQDLKNSGFELDVDQQARLGAYFKDLESKEQIINANKHSWKRRSSDKLTADGQVVWKRGDLVLDKNNQPVREDNWNLDTKKKYSPDNERFEQRNREFFAAEERKNPKITELPSQRTGKTNHSAPNGENGENGTNGKKLNGKNNGKVTNGKKLLAGSVITGALTNFMPTKSAAEEIYPMIQSGNYGDAAKTYGKDLVVGQSMSRAMGSAVNMLKSKFGKNISKALAKKALQIAGRQLVKKGAALATGPAAPIVMTSLLIKDAYDVANALSGGALEPGKPTSTNRKRLRHGRK